MVKRRSNPLINALHQQSLPSRPMATQTLTPAQIEAAVEEYFASAASLDAQRYANHFVAEGVLEDPVGTPPIEGQQAIAAFYAAGTAALTELKPTVQKVIAAAMKPSSIGRSR